MGKRETAYCPDCGADVRSFEPHARSCKSRQHCSACGWAPVQEQKVDFGNSVVRHVGRISIACMAPDARDLLDRAMVAWAEFDAQREPKPQDPVYSFAYWLFRWSGLIPLPAPTPAPALREALAAIQALAQRICERETAMGDRDLADALSIRAQAEAALRASEGPPIELSVSSKDVTWRFKKPEAS